MEWFQINPSWFYISPWLVIIAALVVLAFVAIAILYGIRAHRQQIAAGKEELIGKTAETATVMDPRGTVLIQGEHWVAISDKGRIEPGEEVIITKVEGLKLRVMKKE
ncbi:MAG: NfeD family protein [Dehalococcoidales bacterium]|nr:NfeD family protein [Dehalococcoidales bacterium]